MTRARRWVVFVALGLAATGIAALHIVQPELDPVAQPLSFYVWGPVGWLMPCALGAFGLALLVLAQACPRSVQPRRMLGLAGAALLLTALVPSDRWFPWERPPTVSGLVHAAGAMIAPLLLAWPMVSLAPPRDDTRLRRALPWIVGWYFAALLGSAGSLTLGFVRDAPPPWIGLLERGLAGAALSWVGAFAWQARRN